MKGIKWMILILVGPLTACGNSNIDDAKNAVKMRLTDPSSAEFSQVTVFDGDVVCGSVNAKNQMGGYTGKNVFIYTGLNKNQVKLEVSSYDVEVWCKAVNPKTQLVMLESMCNDAKNDPAMSKARDSICESKEKMMENLSKM